MGMLAASVENLRSKSVSEQREVLGKFVELDSEGGGGKRKRLFYPVRIFWMFLNQVLSGNISCSETLQKILAWLCLETGRLLSPNTAAYCKARQRLDGQWLHLINQQIVKRMDNEVSEEQLGRGRPVRVVDGSGLSMPDTPANQEMFPQSKRQKKGCGFPTMRIMALLSFGNGRSEMQNT